MVDVVIAYPVVGGVMTSLVDAYLGLRELGVEARLIVVDDLVDLRTQLAFMRRLMFSTPLIVGEPTCVHLTDLSNVVDGHVAVISFCSFRFVVDLPTTATRWVVLDAGRMIYDRLVDGHRVINLLNARADVVVLGGAVNAHDVRRYVVWHHWFTRARLEHVDRLGVNGMVFDEAVRVSGVNGDVTDEQFRASSLTYRRWNEVLPGVFNENIGKAIFEFAALGRSVSYSPVNKTHDDGLTEYLALFDVDDDVEQAITIPMDRLLATLGPRDDVFVQMVKGT